MVLKLRIRQTCLTRLMMLLMVGTCTVSHRAVAVVHIEVEASEFSASTYLTEQQQAEVRETGILRGVGEAEYSFPVPGTTWYELWVEAAPWPTDLYLDGEFLIHTPFASGVWKPRGKAEKVMNLYLTEGRHTLRFSHPGHPGLPYMKRFFLEPASDVTGKVRLISRKDYLVFRRNEAFAVRLMAGEQDSAYSLAIRFSAVEGKAAIPHIEKQIPAGKGVYEEELNIPTDREGVFDLTVMDERGRAVDRVIQYLVVDTKQPPPAPEELKKEQVATIDCARQKPDYASGETRVIKAPFGSYVESGAKGAYEYHQEADFFAYVLELPSIQEPYLVEVDYPDDDERSMTISILEKISPSYSLGAGVASGGPYSLSHKMQTQRIFFYPREKNPRLHVMTWHTGERAAASQIRVYRITSGFPALPSDAPGRLFGLWYEELLNFPVTFGGMPEGNQWPGIYAPAKRWARWSRYIGANLWHQTISVYGGGMWPSRVIPDLNTSDESHYSVIGAGPATLKEPFKKDLIRLMLLTCEKYGLDFVGELHMGVTDLLRRYFDTRFGSDGTIRNDVTNKPWLIISKDDKSSRWHYFNPLYPGVQDWVAEVFQELAERYKDSSAFKGVGIRLMGWAFTSWQAFPSINWGYDDYTVGLFEKETGIKVPVATDNPERFGKRFEWLMANAYARWVEWRCKKIHQYYDRLASILSQARSDLKLYIDAFGPHYADGDWAGNQKESVAVRDEKGWLHMIREAGIDPALYNDDPRIVFSDMRQYPAGIRVNGLGAASLAAAQRDDNFDPQPVEAAAKPAEGGTVSAVRFGYEYMEASIPSRPLGVDKTERPEASDFFISGALNPAGRHALARYANALADGNITFMSDGGNVYILGQPQFLRPFITEYRSLPAIGMKRYEKSGDPVALWFGQQESGLYFYLVNRADYPVDLKLRFTARPTLKRLSSGETATVKRDGTLYLLLEPYQLLAFVNEARDSEPADLVVRVPEGVKQQLQKQMSFIEKLLAGKDVVASTVVVPFSVMDQQRAVRQLAKARQAYDDGRYWTARQALMSHHLVKIYEAFDAYPPDLFHRKAREKPEQALLSETLMRKVTPLVRILLAGDCLPDSPAVTASRCWRGAMGRARSTEREQRVAGQGPRSSTNNRFWLSVTDPGELKIDNFSPPDSHETALKVEKQIHHG